MAKIKSASAVVLMAASALLGGCAFQSFRVDEASMRYAEALPQGLSYAWRQGGKVWLVPAKNVFLGSARTLSGQTMMMASEGSYFTIADAPPSFYIEIDSRIEPLSIPIQ